MTQTISLNENETKVLNSLINQMMDCTGGEFGYLPDADKCGLSKSQFAGYVSALQQKGVFEYLDTDYSQTYGGQFAIKEVHVQVYMATNNPQTDREIDSLQSSGKVVFTDDDNSGVI